MEKNELLIEFKVYISYENIYIYIYIDVCYISSFTFALFYSHWCMEIKCDGNSKTRRSTKKNGQDGCQVRE